MAKRLGFPARLLVRLGWRAPVIPAAPPAGFDPRVSSNQLMFF